MHWSGHFQDMSNNAPASSAVETPGTRFPFFNIFHPLEARTPQHRKRVRSHIAKQQHRREKLFATARRIQGSHHIVENEESPPQRSHVATTPSHRTILSELSVDTVGSKHECSDVSKLPSSNPSWREYSLSNCFGSFRVYPREWHAYMGQYMASFSGIS
jgi:hypothetical protein